MRGIPGSAVILFFVVILLVELLAYLGIIQLLSGKRQRRIFSIIYWAVTVAFLSIWLSAFLNPEKIRETTSYAFFYFVISITILNLVPKGLSAISALISFPLRLLKNKVVANTVMLSGLLLSFGFLLSIGYGISIGKKTLQTNNVDLHFDSLPAELNGLRLVQISDFHLGSFSNNDFLQTTTKAINRLQPDIIVFTGDMVNNYYQEMSGFEEALEQMKAPYGKFAIFGNHDYGDYSNWKTPEAKLANHAEIIRKIRAAGFDLLQNQHAKITIRDTCLYMIGVENWGHKPFPQYAELDTAMENVPQNSFQILLTHDPAHWKAEVIRKTHIPLSLSGHTHGGQFGVKMAGITFSPMYFVQTLWAGLYHHKDQYLYVNQGLGCVGFSGRIDMNPEITLLTLYSNRVETDRK